MTPAQKQHIRNGQRRITLAAWSAHEYLIYGGYWDRGSIFKTLPVENPVKEKPGRNFFEKPKKSNI